MVKSRLIAIIVYGSVLLLPTSSQANDTFALIAGAAVPCTFDSSCVAVSSEAQKKFHLHGMDAVLWSRWYAGASGSLAAGKTGYTYKVDLTAASGTPAKKVCVQAVEINFGPVVKLAYDNDVPPVLAFAVPAGGIPSSISLKGVGQTNNIVRFLFTEGLCTGATPAAGTVSVVFGLVGGNKIEWRNAAIETDEMPPVQHHVAVRVPVH
jgi:hypothetical protein